MITSGSFLTVADLDTDTVATLCANATALEQDPTGQSSHLALPHQTVALLFERPSTRTRLGFEAGLARLGGHAITLADETIQFGQDRESARDTARALSAFVDGIIARVERHETLERLAEGASVPVVNALSDRAHPCEALSDLYFLLSRFDDLDGLRAAWIGDCTNVAHSFAAVCVLAGIDLTIACPTTHQFDDSTVAQLQLLGPGSLIFNPDPSAAVEDAAVIYTDVWTSMGQEAEREKRREVFEDYQVNTQLLEHAPSAVVLHCLPANRGEEVTATVLDGKHSVVWQQAQSRLPMQQAILHHTLSD